MTTPTENAAGCSQERRELEQKRLQQEHGDFTDWWNKDQIDPAHTMVAHNAAHAAWQERARRAAPGVSPSPAVVVVAMLTEAETAELVNEWRRGDDTTDNLVEGIQRAIVAKAVSAGVAVRLEEKTP